MSDELIENEGVQTLLIKDQEEILISFTAESPIQTLISKNWLEIENEKYLVTLWIKGAHGEALRIFHPKKKKMVYELKASSPFVITYKNGSIDIIKAEESLRNNPPKKYLINWTPESESRKLIEE